MSIPCTDCAGPTVWDDAAASEICTSCGHLTDASQVILTNQDYRTESGTHELRLPAAPNILKSRSNYTFAGQGQGVRDQKNALTMATFIESLALAINAPGLTPRATTLFNQAKAVNYFRWGRRARTVAGACLSVALRESNRPDSIHDISTLLRCSPHLLSRTFISLTSALKITRSTVDPCVYIGTLQGYLATILEEDQVVCDIPAPLLKSFRQVSFHAVANTALSLGRILSRSAPSDSRSKFSAASTGCAIFMLSLEAEMRETLESLADLAKCLAGRCHIGKGVVMSQYKVIQDQVAKLVEKVPWLEKYEQKGGRAKISKRLIVARGLKDVIHFNEEILQNVLLPEVHLDLSNEEKIEDACGDQLTDNDDLRPTKRRKLHRSLDEASRFLLNPFNTAKASSSSAQRISARPEPTISKFPLTSYVLSVSSLSSVSHKPPTRLQLLAAARGGSGEDAIHNDELFGEGELEALIRNDDEINFMRRILDLNDDSLGSTHSNTELHSTSKAKLTIDGKRRGGQQREPRPKKSRVSLEALAKFMQGFDPADNDRDADGEGDMNESSFSLLGLDDTLAMDEDDLVTHMPEDDDDAQNVECDYCDSRASTSGALNNSGGMKQFLESWRPASPSGGIVFEDRYEEDPG